MNTRSCFALFYLLSLGVGLKAADTQVQAPIEQKEVVTQKTEDTVKVVKEEKKVAKKEKKEKYVVIDAQQIIMDTGLDKEPTKELANLQQKYQKELKEMADGVLKMEQELKTKAATLSADALKAKQAELEEENQKMQLRLNRANNELRAADMQARTKVFQQLQQFAQETLVDKQGHKLVFERSGGIIAFTKGVDKSDDIIKVVKADMAKKAKAEAAKKEVKAKTAGEKEAKAEKETKAVGGSL